MQRRDVSLALLWAALVMSFIYSTAKGANDVSASGVPLDVLIRGAGPIGLLVPSLIVSRPETYRWSAASKLLIAFSLWAMLSTLWSVDWSVTFMKAVQYLTCSVVVILLASHYASFRSAAQALCALVHGALVWTAVEFVVAPSSTFSLIGEYESRRRLHSVAPEMAPNPLAWLCVAGIAALLLGVGPRWTRVRGLNILLLGLYLAELLATRTRTALALGLLLVVSIAIVAIGRRFGSRARTSMLIGLALAAAAAIGMLLSPLGAGPRSFLLRGEDLAALASGTGRTTLWSAALHAWLDHPVLGLGYYSGHRLGIPGLSSEQSNLDSTWIETLVDVGLVGVILLLGAFVLGMWNLATCPRSRLQLWSLTTAGYGAIISFLNPTLQSPGLGFVLVSVLIIAADPRSLRAKAPNEQVMPALDGPHDGA